MFQLRDSKPKVMETLKICSRYIYVRMYGCTNVRMPVRMPVRIYICTIVCLYIHTYNPCLISKSVWAEISSANYQPSWLVVYSLRY